MSGISSMGELVCGRTLEKTATGFVPGQHHAKIIDPRPKRDRADLAAILTYVDDDGMACSVLCLRHRDDGWRAATLKRAGLQRSERTTTVTPELAGELLVTLQSAADGVEPFAFEEPSQEELAMRRLAHKLWDRVAPSGAREDGGDDA